MLSGEINEFIMLMKFTGEINAKYVKSLRIKANSYIIAMTMSKWQRLNVYT